MSRPCWVMAVFLALAAVASAQSLGVVAEKEKARRKEARESGAQAKSYGDEDLGRSNRESGTARPDAEAESGADKPRAKAGTGDAAGPDASGATEESAEEPEELSDMDRLRQKIRKWRASYREVKPEVDALEREVADLAERLESGEGGGLVVYPGDRLRPVEVVAQGELLADRLEEARAELQDAKQRLAEIIEAARRDGVRYGQLY